MSDVESGRILSATYRRDFWFPAQNPPIDQFSNLDANWSGPAAAGGFAEAAAKAGIDLLGRIHSITSYRVKWYSTNDNSRPEETIDGISPSTTANYFNQVAILKSGPYWGPKVGAVTADDRIIIHRREGIEARLDELRVVCVPRTTFRIFHEITRANYNISGNTISVDNSYSWPTAKMFYANDIQGNTSRNAITINQNNDVRAYILEINYRYFERGPAPPAPPPPPTIPGPVPDITTEPDAEPEPESPYIYAEGVGAPIKKTVRKAVPFLTTTEDKINYATSFLNAHKDSKGRLRVVIPSLYHPYRDGDSVHVVNKQLGIDGEYIIKSVQWIYPESVSELILGEFEYDYTHTQFQIAEKLHTLETNQGRSPSRVRIEVDSFGDMLDSTQTLTAEDVGEQSHITRSDPPTLSVLVTGGRTLQANWSHVTGADGYTIRYRVSGTTTYTTIDVDSPFATEHLITGLTAGTTYRVSIAATLGETSTPYSAEVDRVARAGTPSKLNPPTNIRASLNGTTAVVRWNTVSGAEGYRVYWHIDSDDGYEAHMDVSGGTTNNATITGLMVNTVYDVYVASRNDSGGASTLSDNSDVVTITTGGNANSLKVENVSATPVSDGETIVTWDPVIDNNGYEYRYGISGSYTEELTIENTVTITGLTSFSGQGIQVRFYNSMGGVSEWSDVEPFRSPASTLEPPNYSVSTRTAGDRITVTWTAVTGATAYRIFWREENGIVNVINVTGTSHNISTTRNRRYSVQMASYDGMRYGRAGLSTSIVAGVDQGTPDPPTGLTGTSQSREVTLFWDAVSGATRYQIGRFTSLNAGTPVATYASQTTRTRTITGLDNGTRYYFGVRARNATGWGVYSEKILLIPRDPLAPPTAPQNVRAVTGNGQLTLRWDAVAGATSYRIQRYSSQGDTTVDETYADTINTSAVIRPLTNNQIYWFEVRSINSVGTGAASTRISGTPNVVPPAPTNVQAGGSNNSVTVRWQAVGGATAYSVRRYSSSSTSTVSQTYADQVGTSLVVPNLTNGITYWFDVRARNSAGYGPPSSRASASPFVPLTIPSTPQNVVIDAGNGQLTVRWDAVIGASTYTVRRYATEATPVISQAYTPTTNNEIVITGLTNEVEYWFDVRARNSAGTSQPAARTSGTPIPPPGAPSNVRLETGNSQLVIRWNAVTDATLYAVRRYSTRDTTIVSQTYADQSVTSLVVANLNNGTEYWFDVVAKNSSGTGAASVRVNGTPNIAPAAPTDLRVTIGNAQLILTWDPSPTATTYSVRRYSTDSTTTVAQTYADQSGTTITITGLGNGITYWFDIRGRNNAGYGDASVRISGRPNVVPGTPIVIAESGNGQVNLNWNAVTGAASYIVRRYSSQTTTTIAQTYTSTTNTSFVVRGLSNNVRYWFDVRATNNAGTGTPSARVSGTPVVVPPAPDNVSVATGNGQVTVSWDSVSTATVYSIRRYGSESTITVSETYADQAATSLTISGLSNGITYWFDVRAGNAAGYSAPSTRVSGLPNTIPTAPQNVTATAGNQEITLSWDPVNTATVYSVRRYTTQTTQTVAQTYVDQSGASRTIPNLSNGVTYWFDVRARNSAGYGSASDRISGTPNTVPDTPSNVMTEAGDRQVTITWNSVIGADAYTVRRYGSETTNTVAQTYADVTTTSITITNLTNGTLYWFDVRGLNEQGHSTASTRVSATPNTVPGVASNIRVEPGDTQLVIRWDAVARASLYSVRRYATAITTTVTETYADQVGTDITITGLTNNITYWFDIVAKNDIGSGTATTRFSGTPNTVPGAPQNVSVEAGNEQVTVSWDGVLTATAYSVRRYGSETTTTVDRTYSDTANTSLVITGLTNGDTYWFDVRARNGAGLGTASDRASGTPVAPLAAPTAPQAVTAVAGDQQITVSWDAVEGAATYNVRRYATETTTTVEETYADTTTPTFVVTGLTNDITYWFDVVAVNVAGTSSASDRVSSTPNNETGNTLRTTYYRDFWFANGDAPFSDYATLGSDWSPIDTAGGTAETTAKAGIELLGRIETIHSYTIRWHKLAHATATYTFATSDPGHDVFLGRDISVNAIRREHTDDDVAIHSGRILGTTDGDITVSTGNIGVNRGATVPYDTSFRIFYSVPTSRYSFSGDTITVAGAYAWRTSKMFLVDNRGPTDIPISSVNHVVKAPIIAIEYTYHERGEAPPIPTGISAEGGDTQVTISWTASSGATLYAVSVFSSDEAVTPIETYPDVSTTTYIATGLDNGSEYWFSVVARNTYGTSDASIRVSATPAELVTVPGVPMDITSTIGDATVTLAWTAVATATAYSIRRYSSETATTVDEIYADVTETAATIMGLSNDVTYWFDIRALNAAGHGTASARISGTPSTGPDVPQNVEVTAGDHQLTISWDAVTGAASYTVRRYVDKDTMTVAETYTDTNTNSFTITNLSNGTVYWFDVIARNVIGTSVESTRVSGTPNVLPAAPANVAYVPDSGQVTISWEAVDTATSYSVRRYSDATTMTIDHTYEETAATSITAASLTNGTSYWFDVRARNSAGYSPASERLEAIPHVALGAPQNVMATSGNTSVRLSWDALPQASAYRVRRYSSETTTTVDEYYPDQDDTDITITGLTNGTTYWFDVRGRTTEYGEASARISVTPTATRPTQVMNLKREDTPTERYRLVWDPVPGATSYQVRSYFRETDTSRDEAFAAQTETAIVIPVVHGRWYGVRAHNSLGYGPESLRVYMVSPPPRSPTITAVTLNQQAVVTWVSTERTTSYTLRRYTDQHIDIPDHTYPSTDRTGIVATGLTNGVEYWFEVTAENEEGEAPPSTRVQIIPNTRPEAPANFRAEAGNAQVILQWDAVENASTYIVERYSSNTDQSPDETYSNITGTIYTVSNLTNGTTYWFTVRGNNSAALQGLRSSRVFARPAAPVVIPSAPQRVRARVGDGQIIISWNGVAAANYYLVRRYSSRTSTAILQTYEDTRSNSLTATGLTNGTTYWFAVFAVNTSGTSPASTRVSGTPAGLVTSPGGISTEISDREVKISWNAVAMATSYSVRRYSSETTNTPIQTYNDTTATSLTATGLRNGTTYWFDVRSRTSAGYGQASARVSARPNATPGIPGDVSAEAGNGQVIIRWDSSVRADTYSVRRYTSGSTNTVAQTYSDTTSRSLTATGLSNGTTYWFDVRAKNNAGTSPASTRVSATPVAPLTAPSAPGNVRIVSGDRQVTIRWNAVASANTYIVRRYGSRTTSTVAQTYEETALTNATITGLSNNTTYWFAVFALNNAGSSGASTRVSATPAGLLAAPGGVSTSIANGSVTISWNAVSGSTGYRVRRYSSSSSTAILQTYSDTTSTSLTASGLTNGVTYWFAVETKSSAGYGSASSRVSGRPNATPPAPSGVNAEGGNGQVEITWNAASRADVYIVRRYSSRTTNTVARTYAETTSRSLTASGLTNGTTYWFDVRAKNNAGTSGASTRVSATPAVLLAAPSGVSTAIASGQVTVSWNAVSGATGYSVRRYSTRTSTTVLETYADTTDTSLVAMGLNNGTTYWFDVRTESAAGYGDASSRVSARPNATPARPSGVTVEAGNGQLTIRWSAAARADSYSVRRYSSSSTNTVAQTYDDTSSRSLVVLGLTNGTDYWFDVRAKNNAGTSAASTRVSGTPQAPLPPAPSGVYIQSIVFNSGRTFYTLVWNAVSGATKYRLRQGLGSSNVARLIVATGTTYDGILSTQNGGWVTVAAINAVGEGPQSERVTIRART